MLAVIHRSAEASGTDLAVMAFRARPRGASASGRSVLTPSSSSSSCDVHDAVCFPSFEPRYSRSSARSQDGEPYGDECWRRGALRMPLDFGFFCPRQTSAADVHVIHSGGKKAHPRRLLRLPSLNLSPDELVSLLLMGCIRCGR